MRNSEIGFCRSSLLLLISFTYNIYIYTYTIKTNESTDITELLMALVNSYLICCLISTLITIMRNFEKVTKCLQQMKAIFIRFIMIPT